MATKMSRNGAAMAKGRESKTQDEVTPQSETAGPGVWLGFLAMCIGMFMAILDIQIVATSLPAIRAALKISPDQMSWIQTSYLIAEIIAIPMTGLLTRALSLRRLFLAALSLFTLASIACALSSTLPQLIAARVVQGLAGGCLIPLVFSAVFLLFPKRQQGIATTIAGVLAVLAPTLGPTFGGYITETFSWPWLFLVNVLPGLLACGLAFRVLPCGSREAGLLKTLDWLSLGALALSLASLEILMKEAPERGWLSGWALLWLAFCLIPGGLFIGRSLLRNAPLTNLRLFAERDFAIACAASFLLGIGLFGSVYLMPVFLGLVREHGPLTIGLIMLVTGSAQLLTAPVTVRLELRYDARVLAFFGFTLFAVGLGLSAFQTRETDFAEMFWPQVLRGAGIMFCLIPPTRIALGRLAPDSVPDGSALFNLMRNMGGAIGIGLIDTVIWNRAPVHAEELGERVLGGDLDAAEFVGIPAYLVPDNPDLAPGPEAIAFVAPLFEKAGLVMAINDAWGLIGLVTLAALAVLPFARRTPNPQNSAS